MEANDKHCHNIYSPNFFANEEPFNHQPSHYHSGFAIKNSIVPRKTNDQELVINNNSNNNIRYNILLLNKISWWVRSGWLNTYSINIRYF